MYVAHIYLYIWNHWILSSSALAASSLKFEPAEDEPELRQMTFLRSGEVYIHTYTYVHLPAAWAYQPSTSCIYSYV